MRANAVAAAADDFARLRRKRPPPPHWKDQLLFSYVEAVQTSGARLALGLLCSIMELSC